MKLTLVIVTTLLLALFSLSFEKTVRERAVRTSQGIKHVNWMNNCGNFVCGSTDKCCTNNVIGIYKSVCYNPNSQKCIQDEGNKQNNCLCPLSSMCCSGVCYDPTLYQCVNGKLDQNNNNPEPPNQEPEPSFIEPSFPEQSFIEPSIPEQSFIEPSFPEQSFVEPSGSSQGSEPFEEISLPSSFFSEPPTESPPPPTESEPNSDSLTEISVIPL